MSSSPLRPTLSLLLSHLAVLLLLAAATATPRTILSPLTQRVVPLRALAARRGLPPHAEVPALLFELHVASGRLTNGERTLDLHTLAPHISRVDSHPRTRVSVNGHVRRVVRPVSAVVRRGPHFVVVQHAHGPVITVYGPGIALTPVHVRDHPNLFVNVHAATRDAPNPHKRERRAHHAGAYVGDEVAPAQVSSSHRRHRRRTRARGGKSVLPEAITAVDAAGNVVLPSSLRQASTSCRDGSVVKVVDVAIASDNSLCAAHADNEDDARLEVMTRFGLAAEPYAQQTCLRLNLASIELNCGNTADPYASLRGHGPSETLEMFREIWRNSRTDVDRDIAYFLPGFFDTSATSGVAYVGGACSPDFGFGWVEGLEPVVMAHEMGHNFNCPHSDDGGLMRAAWMAGDPIVFSGNSLTVLFDFVDRDDRASCLEERRNGGNAAPTKPPATTRGGGGSGNRTPTTVPATTTRIGTRPRGGDGTCASDMNARNAMACSKKSLGQIFFDEHKVEVTVNQRAGRFIVSLKTGSAQTKLTRLSVLPSMSKTVVANSMPDADYFGDGVLRKSYVVRMGKVAVGASTSCCGRPLYVHVDITFCHDKRCGSGLIVLASTVECSVCVGRLMSMTKVRECPICKAN